LCFSNLGEDGVTAACVRLGRRGGTIAGREHFNVLSLSRLREQNKSSTQTRGEIRYVRRRVSRNSIAAGNRLHSGRFARLLAIARFQVHDYLRYDRARGFGYWGTWHHSGKQGKVRMKQFSWTLTAVAIVVSSQAFAWGERGHHAICEVATRLVQN